MFGLRCHRWCLPAAVYLAADCGPDTVSCHFPTHRDHSTQCGPTPALQSNAKSNADEQQRKQQQSCPNLHHRCHGPCNCSVRYLWCSPQAATEQTEEPHARVPKSDPYPDLPRRASKSVKLCTTRRSCDYTDHSMGRHGLPSLQAWLSVTAHEIEGFTRLTLPPATRSEPTQQQQTRIFSGRCAQCAVRSMQKYTPVTRSGSPGSISLLGRSPF